MLEGYPSTPVVVEITSSSMREKLLEKMKKQAESKAKEEAEKNEVHVKGLYEWMCSLLYES